MINRWIKWRYMRYLVMMKKKSIKVMRMLESRETIQMDAIQKLVFAITPRLIHDQDSELRSNSIDYTYHIENENYLIIIRSQSGHYSINLIEYKTRQLINNFDVLFDVDHIKIIIDNFVKNTL